MQILYLICLSFPEQCHENKNRVLDHQLFDGKCFTYKLAQKFKREKGKKVNLFEKEWKLTKYIFFMLM